MRKWDKSSGGRHDFWGDTYEYRPTIEARGGIKTQSRRGVFGESWWAKRWIGVLESFNIGTRLSRGRSYARSGQVLSIDISEGKVNAHVQGSRPQPYEVSITMKTLTDSDWRKLASTLSTQAIFAAKLLAGEMPPGIEEAFRNSSLSLFPTKLRDLETDCSCPDSSNPCKHIAAVYYLIGEEFDRDPFLLFRLRGKGREDFIKLLGAEPPQQNAGSSSKEEEPRLPPEPLTSDAASFWSGGVLPEDFLGEVRLPTVVAALPKRLGNFPFWRGDERFQEAIEAIYEASATRALDVVVRLVGEGNKFSSS